MSTSARIAVVACISSLNPTRRGNILAVTLAVVMIVAYLLAASADNVVGVKRQGDAALSRQKAIYAAEAVAADQEDTLVQLAGTNNLAALEGLTPNYGESWMNDCVVRWRIEPVRVRGTDATSAHAPIWSVNPPANVSQYNSIPSLNFRYTGAPNDGTYVTNSDYYVYRIATEAYALADPNFSMVDAGGSPIGEAAMPWNVPGSHVAHVQSSRVIQLRLNSLFKYCIFYAASGPTGDIEFHPGATMQITGAVHSNGSIFMGGSGAGLSAPPPDGGSVFIGGTLSGLGSPTTVVGIGGIYRQRKSLDYYFNQFNPFTIPLVSNLNGGTSSVYQINDHPLECATDGSYCNDSRSPATLTSVYGAYVRDGKTLGATTVTTLSNIPQLAGRPFEPVQQAPTGSFISVQVPANPWTSNSNWTIYPSQYVGSMPLLYKNPGAATPDYTLTITPWYTIGAGAPQNAPPLPQAGAVIVSSAVPATGLPLYANQSWGPVGQTDVCNPNASLTPQGFSANEALSPYLNDVFLGKGDGTYGVAIRERTTQDLTRWGGAGSIEPISGKSYNTLLAARGLPTDGTRPESTWGIYHQQVEFPSVSGNCTIEAESFDGQLSNPIESWVPARINSFSQTSPTAPNVSGVESSLMLGRTYSIAGINTAFLAGDVDSVPRLDYNVKLGVNGTYQVYLRGLKNGGNGAVYIGWSTPTGFQPAPNPTAITLPTALGWSNGVALLSPPQIAGEYVLHVWMGDDRDRIDEIYITKNGAPSGAITETSPTLTASALSPVTTYPALPLSYPVGMMLYMKSQYAAMVGTVPVTAGVPNIVDITDVFFGYNATAAVDVNGLVAYEADIMNSREADYMRQYFMGNNAIVTGPGVPSTPRAYRCNVITFNMDMLQANIRANAITTFNGLIYCCRTRRSSGYDPINQPAWNPSAYLTNFSNWTPDNAWYERRSNNRVPAGPDCIFHEGVRLARGATIDWGGRSTGSPARIRGLTFVTPNSCYIQGDYNIVADYNSQFTSANFTQPIPVAMQNPPYLSDATTVPYMEGQLKRLNTGYGGPYTALSESTVMPATGPLILFPPCAVFSDQLTVLSNNWTDSQQYGALTTATETWYNISTILNNVPTDNMNMTYEGSGGVHNVVRFLENWGGAIYHFRGSLVCMNNAKFTRGNVLNDGSEVTTNPFGSSPIDRITGYTATNPGATAYSPPNRDLRFNTDLLTSAGQPPFSPFGVNLIRTVSTINDGDQ